MSIATPRDEALGRLRWARKDLADAKAKGAQASREIEFWEPLVDAPEAEIKAALDQRKYRTPAAPSGLNNAPTEASPCGSQAQP